MKHRTTDTRTQDKQNGTQGIDHWTLDIGYIFKFLSGFVVDQVSHFHTLTVPEAV